MCLRFWCALRAHVAANRIGVVGVLVAIAILSGYSVDVSADDRQALWDAAWRSLYEDNRPLKALAHFEALTRTGWLHTNTLAQFHAISGDLIGAEALAYASMAQDTAEPAQSVDCDAYRRVPAVPAILDMVRSARVVMINEGHHVPMHRAFSATLLDGLRELGFNAFGAETFVPEVGDRVEQYRTPVIELGPYSVEPVFGELVRRAIALEYVLFPYEWTTEQRLAVADPSLARAAREQSQAANLHRYLTARPGVRAFIHAGGGHVRKDVPDDGLPMMAYRFKQLSGIDPVSINQVGGTPSPALKWQNPLYRGVERCGVIDEAIVLVAEDGSHLAHEGYDMTVFFPHVSYADSRPDWMQTMLGRRGYQLGLAVDEERSLVRAFDERDPPNAVAVDQMLVPPMQDRVVLSLPPGRYRLSREWNDGRAAALGVWFIGP